VLSAPARYLLLEGLAEQAIREPVKVVGHPDVIGVCRILQGWQRGQQVVTVLGLELDRNAV
jgi:hypothetical protein